MTPLPNAEAVLDLVSGWIEDYDDNLRTQGLKMRSPHEFIPEGTPQSGNVARNRDAVLRQKTSDLVHQPRSIGHEALTDAVHRLQRQLIGRLLRHEAHRGSTDSLADRLGIVPIALVGLHVGRDKLWRDQTYLVAKSPPSNGRRCTPPCRRHRPAARRRTTRRRPVAMSCGERPSPPCRPRAPASRTRKCSRCPVMTDAGILCPKEPLRNKIRRFAKPLVCLGWIVA